MKLIKQLSLVTLFAFMAISSSSYSAQGGQDGQPGEIGHQGDVGKSGQIGINWVPRDPNPEYFFYIPIKNQDIVAFKKVLTGGAKLNWPMSNIVGRPTAFEVAMESLWVEGIKVMLENPDPKNQPDLGAKVKARNGASVNIYEQLTIGNNLDEKGALKSSNFSVKKEQIEILKLVLKYEKDLDHLEFATGAKYNLSKVYSALNDVTNPYYSYPNNVEARELIETRRAELKNMK